MAKNIYSEDKIKTLSAIDHIRLRPGMYIGRLGDGSNINDGIYILLKEIVDNSIDEFISGYGDKIEITTDVNQITVRDYGRGIPLGKVIDCVSVINTGAKYNSDVFQYSVGLNGVGTKAVNALSSLFEVTSFRDGKYLYAKFEKGKLISKKEGKTKEENGTLTSFIADNDEKLFSDYKFEEQYIIDRLQNYAYLNTGLSLYLNGKRYYSKTGLLDLIGKEVGEDSLYNIISYKTKDKKIEFAFTHTANYGENYFSYVNGQHTSDGGTHLSAFKEGILKGINEFYKKSYSAQDVRDGLTAAISIKLTDPIFESQTKNKLGNTEIRAPLVNEVKNAIAAYLLKDNKAADALQVKINQNESIRKELNAVRKNSKEAAKKVSINIANLKDCKYHLSQHEKGEDTMIFLTEGQSASGSMVSARDVYTQAIFSLRGKVLNVFGKKKTDIYKNEELYNLMVALGIENGIDALRYGKIIIATDADNDGFHIRNLLLTYFLSYFSDLVIAERLYILETPLFRVRNKKNTVYCYSEKERDIAKEQIKNSEITRFKGLGEISPKEFGQFISDDMRLLPITLSSVSEMHKTMKFYMGSNTAERKDFILENII